VGITYCRPGRRTLKHALTVDIRADILRNLVAQMQLHRTQSHSQQDE